MIYRLGDFPAIFDDRGLLWRDRSNPQVQTGATGGLFIFLCNALHNPSYKCMTEKQIKNHPSPPYVYPPLIKHGNGQSSIYRGFSFLWKPPCFHFFRGFPRFCLQPSHGFPLSELCVHQGCQSPPTGP